MSFKEIFGHEKAIAMLQRTVAGGRVPHAYLFSGIEGVGKALIARQFAKALNCLEGGADACDRCISCAKIDRNRHPDLIGVQAEGQFIRIKEIREIQNQMRFSPLEGRFRVFMLNEADRMNSAAANALLKTLEEPAARNVLILLTSRPHALPATILSRCQRLRFDPIPTQTVAGFLMEMAAVAPAEASVLAASSGGSIGRALEMNKGAYVAMKNVIIDRFCDLKDPLDFFPFLSDFGADKDEALERLDILLTWHRDLLYCREGGDVEPLIHRDRLDLLRDRCGKLSAEDIMGNIRAIQRTRKALARNANRQLALECLIFRFMQNDRRKIWRRPSAAS